MLRENILKRALEKKRLVYGIINSIPSPAMIELVAESGYDFVIIDTEHVMVNPETIENMIRTAESYNLTPLVRTSDFNPKTMLKLLDAGAQGVVLPMVEEAQDVIQAVAACKYFPEGNRSLNAGRPGAFGKFPLVDYIEKANQEMMVVAMIESKKGVDNIESIMTVPGLDMILEGAADLSQSLNVPWNTAHPSVTHALSLVRQACQLQNIPCCAIPRSPEDHKVWLEDGVRAFVLGDDRGTAFRALHQKLTALRTDKEIA